MEYDVFLSYRRSTGADVARMMALALTARGYRVYFDYGSVREGSASQEVFAAIDSADVFMLMMTEGSLDVGNSATEWVRTELFYAMSKKKHVVPVGPTNQKWNFPVDLPDSIAAVSNLQVSRLDMESLFEESIDKIERERFTEEFRARKKRKQFVLNNMGSAVGGVCCRESELMRLREALFAGRIAIVSGEVGIGKTALLRHYAQIAEQDYPGGVFTFPVRSTWEEALEELGAQRLNTGKTFNEQCGLSPQTSASHVRDALMRLSSDVGPVLLVVEDVPSVMALFPKGIYSLFPAGLLNRSRIEIAVSTLVNDASSVPWAQEIALPALSKDDSLVMLQSVHPVGDECDRKAAEEVAELLRGRPGLLCRVPRLIGDEFAEVMCDDYSELASLLREDFEGTIAAAK